MKRSSSQLGVAFVVGSVAVIGVGILLVFLARGSQTIPSPTTSPMIPDPATSPIIPDPMTSIIPAADANPVVASVNGQPIRYSSWLKAVRLDQVLSDLAGQPIPVPGETLERLIDQELVLQALPQERASEPDQVGQYIARLQDAWGVDDATLVTALTNVGLIRADLERAVARLLTVQAGLDALGSQGQDTSKWLEDQWAGAEIEIDQAMENATMPYTPIAQVQSQPPPATTEVVLIPTAIPVPATTSPAEPAPTPATDRALPEIAPDFTLDRASGGRFTLSEQLAQGPVVLVFFQKCG